MDAITDRIRALTEGLDTRFIDPVSGRAGMEILLVSSFRDAVSGYSTDSLWILSTNRNACNPSP